MPPGKLAAAVVVLAGCAHASSPSAAVTVARRTLAHHAGRADDGASRPGPVPRAWTSTATARPTRSPPGSWASTGPCVAVHLGNGKSLTSKAFALYAGDGAGTVSGFDINGDGRVRGARRGPRRRRRGLRPVPARRLRHSWPCRRRRARRRPTSTSAAAATTSRPSGVRRGRLVEVKEAPAVVQHRVAAARPALPRHHHDLRPDRRPAHADREPHACGRPTTRPPSGCSPTRPTDAAPSRDRFCYRRRRDARAAASQPPQRGLTDRPPAVGL